MAHISILNELIYLFGVDIASSKYHKCWSVGNNKTGQQCNRQLHEGEHNQRLQLMNKLPHKIYIDDIITGCWGSTYILCNDYHDLIVFGCNLDGQLSIGSQIIRMIIHQWTQDLHPLFAQFMATPNAITRDIEKRVGPICSNVRSLHTPLMMDEYSLSPQHKILFMSQGIPSHHKFLVTQDKLSLRDHVFGIGRNDHNQLGASDKANMTQFTEIMYFSNVRKCVLAQIHCARDYTHFLSEDGKIYEASDRSISVRPIKIATKIIDICCGYEHTLAINENKWIYSWGDNLYAQLGHSVNKSRVTEPKLIRSLVKHNIQNDYIAAGQYHSLIVSTFGQLRVFGWNEFYQCGTGTDHNVISKPTLNLTLANKFVTEIKCGFNHNVAKTMDGEYYLWGHNRFNQCMVYDEDEWYVKVPTKWEYERDIGSTREILAVYPGWVETRVVTN